MIHFKYKWNFPTKGLKWKPYVVYVGYLFLIVFLTLPFVGCASNNGLVIKEDAETIEVCEDDKLYKITKWTEKRLISDTCGKSKSEELK